MMNMNPTQCNELSAEHDERTKWHNDDLRDAQRLDDAWAWLCESRKTAPANADIWHLRQRWPACREAFLRKLQSGEHHLSPMLVVGTRRQVMWSAEDALALKWVALSITPSIPVHEKCEHVKGHGGGRSSVRRISQSLTENGYRWVCRTDIKGYYGAINKETLMLQLREHITRPAYLTILTQYIHYSVEEGGEFYTPEKGIARGCALSPLMGALHLRAVDNYFAHQHKIYYGRYMDDFVILTYSRWQLRKQVKQLNKYLASLGFEKHPDKTFIGKVSRGFDWLGAWLTDKGVVGIAPRALTNHREKVRRLYEQTRHWSKTKQARRVSDYRNRWKIWAVLMASPVAHAASLDPGETLRTSGTWSYTKMGSGAVAGTGSDAAGYGFVISPGGSSAHSLCTLATTFPMGQTTDGYTGVQIAPDVALGLTGTATGPNDTSTSIQRLATWSETGAYAPTYPNYSGYTWCGRQARADEIKSPSTATFSGSWFIHAGPAARPGTYSYSGLLLSRLGASTWPLPAKTVVVPAGSITVRPPTSCTVGLDAPTVKYGTVADTDVSNSSLSVQHSRLTTNCSSVHDGGTGTGRVTTSLSLLSQSGGSQALPLQSSENLQVAEVYARLGNYSVGSCQPGSGSLDFVGTPVTLGDYAVGANVEVITWSLCSNGEKNRGNGSGSATLTVAWP